MDILNGKNKEESQERLRVEAKDKKNILMNRIVAITILSIAFLLGFWGLWKHKNTTNKDIEKIISSKPTDTTSKHPSTSTQTKPSMPTIETVDIPTPKKSTDDVEWSREKEETSSFQTISNNLLGEWEGEAGGVHAKLLISQYENKISGYIIYSSIKEYLSVGIRNNGQVVLKGTRYERLRGKSRFYLDTFYGKVSKDGSSISGNYVDTAGNKGNWSVTKHVYTYKTLPKTSTVPQKSMNEAKKKEKAPKDTEAERQKKVKSSLNSDSLFASRNSRIYHKSNCPKLSTEDLIEFISSQKAQEAGGIPCKYCNPPAFVKGNTLKVESTKIFDITNHVKDSDKFDIHYRVFPSSFQETWYRVIQQLNIQKEKGIQQKKDKGVIATDLTRHGIYGFPKYDKYYIVIEQMNNSSTKVSLKLFTYYRDMKDREFADIVLLPVENKVYMNKRASKFLDKITKKLVKNY